MIILPKPIIRMIMSYIDFDTLCMNPIQILQLMMYGITGNSAIEHRKQIWDIYCNKIMRYTHLCDRKSIIILDEELYQKLLDIEMDNFIENYDEYDDEYDDRYDQDYNKYEKYVHEKWDSFKNQKVINREKHMIFEISDRVDYIISSVYMPSLCFKNDGYTGDYCECCESRLIDGQCHTSWPYEYYNSIVIELNLKAPRENLILFFSYIKYLIKSKLSWRFQGPLKKLFS